MSLPDITPTSRSLNFGVWPVKIFRSNNGAELRRLYGNRRTNLELELVYENVSDNTANQFRETYDDAKGEFDTFRLPGNTYAGWASSNETFTGPTANVWRYKEPPSITSVKRGVSTVRVVLVSVFVQ